MRFSPGVFPEILQSHLGCFLPGPLSLGESLAGCRDCSGFSHFLPIPLETQRVCSWLLSLLFPFYYKQGLPPRPRKRLSCVVTLASTLAVCFPRHCRHQLCQAFCHHLVTASGPRGGNGAFSTPLRVSSTFCKALRLLLPTAHSPPVPHLLGFSDSSTVRHLIYFSFFFYGGAAEGEGERES